MFPKGAKASLVYKGSCLRSRLKGFILVHTKSKPTNRRFFTVTGRCCDGASTSTHSMNVVHSFVSVRTPPPSVVSLNKIERRRYLSSYIGNSLINIVCQKP